MKLHLLFFTGAFAIGCVAALAARSAWFKPTAELAQPSASAAYSQMVTNPSAPAADPHAGHGTATGHAAMTPAATADNTATEKPATAAPEAGKGAAETGTTVNTVCAICGMDVDPSIKPATYKGKLIGFGCRMCPPKFARDPDLYGPAALENKVVPN